MKRAFQPVAASAQQAHRDSDGPDLLGQTEVCRRLGISDETWRRWRRAGRVPAPVQMPSGRLKWRAADLAVLLGPRPEPRRRFFRGAQQLVTGRVVHTRDSQPHPFPMKGRTL